MKTKKHHQPRRINPTHNLKHRNKSIMHNSRVNNSQDSDLNLVGLTDDFITNAIELSDLLKLKTVANVEYVLEILHKIKMILKKIENKEGISNISAGIEGFENKIRKEELGSLMPSTLSENLEFSIANWLNDFRLIIRSK